ncbi:hypothetical protein F0M16_11015 [Vibrio cholerae]|uniref:Uncharacterized protein n=1 Tax=Vibrio cholerae TaxID=666 RepID=A0A5Q6PJG3_VIBCL|nr:hypothetical protein [Vibrio cholerae]KAA1254789.1 hypothetical protein F0M16_11015 [Vibrio cholerae]
MDLLIELIASLLFPVIPVTIFSLMIHEILQEKLEEEIYLQRSKKYQYLVAVSSCFPISLLLIIYHYDPSIYTIYESVFLFLIGTAITTIAVIQNYKTTEYFGSYCISYKRKSKNKIASIHLSPSTNLKLVNGFIKNHSEYKSLYQDLLFSSLENVSPDTNLLVLTSPMLRARSFNKISKIFYKNPKVKKVNNLGKKNFLFSIYYFIMMSCLFRAKVRFRWVYTISIEINN